MRKIEEEEEEEEEDDEEEERAVSSHVVFYPHYNETKHRLSRIHARVCPYASV